MNRLSFAVGIIFGAVIAATRLSEYDVIHNALLLRDLFMWKMFGVTVGVGAPLLLLLQRLGWRPRYGGALHVARSPVSARHIAGGAVFGLGWALAGTCPVPAVAMVTRGGVLGFVVMLGLFAGIRLHERIAAPRGKN